MKEKFYFTLFLGPFVANTYIGTRSNAKAYFLRWINKHIPDAYQYDFCVMRYRTLSNMLNDCDPLCTYTIDISESA